MVNYELGKIYTIRSSETVGVYVGSTCQPLAVRFGGHKSAYKTNNGISSRHIFDYGIENAYIELLENYPCNSKEELHKREGEHIRMMENCVNHSKNTGLSKKEIYKKKLEKEKKDRVNPENYCICKCGERVFIKHLGDHQINSKIHDEFREMMWKNGLYIDGTPRDPLQGGSIGTN
jgi:hypothetical protein